MFEPHSDDLVSLFWWQNKTDLPTHLLCRLQHAQSSRAHCPIPTRFAFIAIGSALEHHRINSAVENVHCAHVQEPEGPLRDMRFKYPSGRIRGRRRIGRRLVAAPRLRCSASCLSRGSFRGKCVCAWYLGVFYGCTLFSGEFMRAGNTTLPYPPPPFAQAGACPSMKTPCVRCFDGFFLPWFYGQKFNGW